MSTNQQEASVKARYDAGLENLSWDLPTSGQNLLQVDFKRILDVADAKVIIQSLPPQILYHSLKSTEPELLPQVLALTSTDQFTRILDYDTWRGGQLVQANVLNWLVPLKENGPIAMAARFRSLEEEYQLATLDKCLKIYDLDEYEALSQEGQNRTYAMPGGQYYYEILAEDETTHQLVHDLIESAVALDMNYAFNLLAHAANLPPNEAEYLLRQFRTARLEEDGFITEEESFQIFIRIPDLTVVSAQYSGDSTKVPDTLPTRVDKTIGFLDSCVAEAMRNDTWSEEDAFFVQQGTLYLANALTVAVRVTIDDLRGMNLLLEQSKALVSLGLEYLSRADLQKRR